LVHIARRSLTINGSNSESVRLEGLSFLTFRVGQRLHIAKFPGMDVDNLRSWESENERWADSNHADPTRNASEVNLSAIVDSVMGSEPHLFPVVPSESHQHGWTSVPCYSTDSVVIGSLFVSGNASGDRKRSRERREILMELVPVTHRCSLHFRLFSLSRLSQTATAAATSLVLQIDLRVNSVC
jgi:hypothetical protein